MISNKEILRASGYPRSGNTYLNYALKHLYYVTEPTNITWHTVAKLDARDKIIVPIRQPLDCISSLNLYPSGHSIDMDIKYYIRFHEAVLNKKTKIVLMNFDDFTVNLEYIKIKIFEHFGLITDSLVTIDEVKEYMRCKNKEINLPRDNKTELYAIKDKLQSMQGYAKCVELYEALQAAHS